MEPIGLPFSYRGVLTAEASALYSDEHRAVRDRAMRVVASANSIEECLASILELVLFRGLAIDQRSKLRSLLIDSEWCSFYSKRKLLTILRNDGTLKVPSWDILDRDLARVMRHRNAFAHGVITTHGPEFKLLYFEGEPREVTLDSDFWKSLEGSFQAASQALQTIERAIINGET